MAEALQISKYLPWTDVHSKKTNRKKQDNHTEKTNRKKKQDNHTAQANILCCFSSHKFKRVGHKVNGIFSNLYTYPRISKTLFIPNGGV